MSALIVTSGQAGDGKSTIAAGLALHLLAGGRGVHILRMQGSDAASAERDAVLLAAVPGVRSPGRALALSKAGEVVKEVASEGVVVVEAEPAEAREAASTWAAGAIVVQRAGATEAALRQAQDVALRQAQGAAALGLAVEKTAVAVTAVAARDLSKMQATAASQGARPLLVLPEDRTLAAPRLGELARALEASFLCNEADQDEVVERVIIGSVGHDPGVPYFSMHERKAALTRFDKTDVQLAALCTPLLCLLLTGGQRPSPYLFDRARSLGVPVLLTARGTVEAMAALGEAYAGVRFGGARKLERLRELFAEHLDSTVLEKLLG
jgi:BioD-like phosphotransacetylase family protein